jgi:hypothetical protein
MPKYKLTDPIYGRVITVDLDKPPTDEDARKYLTQAFPEDKEYTFLNLSQDKQYVSDLRSNWVNEGNEDFAGTNEELVEKDFEYWNMVENNLAMGAYEIATNFANLNEKEAQRMLRRFDVYDRTNATGEGSRSFFEQFKGVTLAMLSDPTTYAGGYGLIKNIVAQVGAKGLLKGILMKVAAPAAIGGSYAAAADAEHQQMMMKLGAQDEYNVGQTATMAGVGAAMNIVAPVAIRGAVGLVKAIPSVVNPKKWKAGIHKVEEATMETLGGAQVAKSGIIDEGKELLAHGGGGHAKASITASNRLNEELSAGFDKFNDEYIALGQLDVRPQYVANILKQLEADGIKGLSNIKFYIDLMVNGKNTPTETLRLIRSQLGKLKQASKVQGSANHGADKVIDKYHKESKKLFQEAAERVGKGKEVVELDSRYAEFMGIHNRTDIIKASGQAGKASDLISHIVSDPKKSFIRVGEYLSEIKKIGKASGNKEFVSEQKKLLSTSLAEELFKGGSGKFQSFVKTPSGKKTLLTLFDDLSPQTLDRWSTILNNSANHGGASTFWGRIFTQTLAGGAGAGLGGFAGGVGATIGAGISFVMMSQFLKSSKFQSMAMRVYSRKKIDQKALSRLENYLVEKGLDDKQARWFTSNISGMVTTKQATANIPEDMVNTATEYTNQMFAESAVQ